MTRAAGLVHLVVAATAASLALAACDTEPTQPAADSSRPALAPPRAETVRECRTAVYGDLVPATRKDALTVGPLVLLVADGERPAAVEPSGVVKVLVLLQTGEAVTVVVPEEERRRVSLLYDWRAGPRRPLRFSDGTSSAQFVACTRSEEWAEEQPYPDPQETQFNGGFFVRGAHCAMLEAWIEGRTDRLRFGVGFGTGGRPCPV